MAMPRSVREMIQRSGRTTVPQIFIDAQHIGGCDDLYALDSRGGLDPSCANFCALSLAEARI